MLRLIAFNSERELYVVCVIVLAFVLSACSGGSSSGPSEPISDGNTKAEQIDRLVGDSDTAATHTDEPISPNTLEVVQEAPPDSNNKYNALFQKPSNEDSFYLNRFNSRSETPFYPAYIVNNTTVNECIEAFEQDDSARFYVTDNFILFGSGVPEVEILRSAEYAEAGLLDVIEQLNLTADEVLDYHEHQFDPMLRFIMQLMWLGYIAEGVSFNIEDLKGEASIPGDIRKAISDFYTTLDEEDARAAQSLLYRYWFTLSEEERMNSLIELLVFFEENDIALDGEDFEVIPFFDEAHRIREGKEPVRKISRFTRRIQICVDDDLSVFAYGYSTPGGIIVSRSTAAEILGFIDFDLYQQIITHEVAHQVFYSITQAIIPITDLWFSEGIAEFLSDGPVAHRRDSRFNVLDVKTIEDADEIYLDNPNLDDLYPHYALATEYLFKPNALGGLENDVEAIKEIALHIRNNTKRTGLPGDYFGPDYHKLFSEAFEANLFDADGVTPLSLELYQSEWETRVP